MILLYEAANIVQQSFFISSLDIISEIV